MRKPWMTMIAHLSRLNRIHLFFILLSIGAETAFASQQVPQVSESVPGETDSRTTLERNALRPVKGRIMLDYEVIPVPGYESLDLLGAHYLHQLNPWLCLGVGLHAPLVYGNYGGFMAFDATLHAQRKIVGNSFFDAGISLGGGGGSSSISLSPLISGTGKFIKSYIGLGYDFRSFSAGINYTHFRFADSLINHSQLDFFFQKPVSYSIGSYAYSGRQTGSDFFLPGARETILAAEFNNLFQLKPTGSNTNSINSLSLQLTHFLNRNRYLFFGLEVGYQGLPLYNQAIGGIGYRYSMSPRINFYGQIGVGSGGYAQAEIDTGPGLLVYPKLSAEYLLSKTLGVSLSTGYLVAPNGTSKNVTVGTALNYHLSTNERNRLGTDTANDRKFRGFRLNMFQQTEFNVRVGSSAHHNINLLSTQWDSILSDHWYLPIQASVATNDFLGYPGYGELLAGLGVQNKFSLTNRFQKFFQVLIGTNINNILLKASVGVNYSLTDNFALYGQLGKTISLNKWTQYAYDMRVNSNSVGLGLTYRFSLP
jgi:hypothetical protein